MPFIEKRLGGPIQLTTSAQVIYTVPSGGQSAVIRQIVVSNTSASATTFTLYIGAESAANALFSGSSVAANDTVIINLSQVLATNEVVRAKASANSALNITMSGVENDGPLAQGATYIPDSAFTASKIAEGAITTSKLGSNAVTQEKLASNLSGITVTTSTSRPSTPFEGQMIYETNTDMVAIWNGSAWRYIAATTPTNGTVLQVVSTTKTDTFSTTSTFVFTDVTGLSVSITPKSTSSKILVTAHILSGNNGGNHHMFNLVRNTTDIAQSPTDTYSSTIGVSFISNVDFKTGSITHLDSPSTISSTTYKIQAKTSGGTLYVNRRGDLASVSGVSSITAMEIAG